MHFSTLLGTSIPILFLTCLACGGTTVEPEPSNSQGGSSGTGGTGGMGGTGGTGLGGSGGATGGTGGATTTSCNDLSGTFLLEGETYYGESPWLWIHETAAFGCTAIVASKRFPGRRYQATLSNTSLMLTPIDEPALSGYQRLTDHHLTWWNEIVLDIASGALAGTGRADVINDWNEEDIWGETPASLDITLSNTPPGKVEAMTLNTLPWRSAVVLASRPTSGLATHLGVAGWSAKDVITPDAEGVIQAELSYAGAWDDVRGTTLSVDVKPSLVDASGAAMETTTLDMGVYDVGPVQSKHEMNDATELATWGPVEPYTEGPCATTGCLMVRGWCGSYAGIAGQLRTEGATEAVLSMRLELFDTYTNTPALSVIEVVAEDGTHLQPKLGGTWVDGQAEQVRVYDVTGYSVVGFAIEASSYCHGWGGPIIVDTVYAQ